MAVALPSLRAYARQTDRLNDLHAKAEAERAEVAALEAELARWDDPAYVRAQARERLSFVMPGEMPYRVIDPETVTGVDGPDASPAEAPIYDRTPWFSTLWDSLENPGAT